MKYQLLFCLAPGLLFLHSCANPSNTPEGDLAVVEDTSFTFRMLNAVDSLYLPTGYEDDLRTGLQAEVNALQLTSGSAAFQQVVADTLRRLLDFPAGGPTDEAFYLRYLQQRKKAYRDEMGPQIGIDGVDFGDFNFIEKVTMGAALNKSGIFTLSTDLYFYRGGASGDFSTHLRAFTDNPAKRWNKEDIFAAGTDETIGKMLAGDVEPRRLYHPDVIFPVTHNFGITPEGIVFYYPTYEVEVLGNGQIFATLPLATLLESNLLTPAGRELLERLQ